jgi:tRNA dimethylallyltransferase
VKKLIVIAGPTASGKTQLAIQIAQHYQTEIVSADSRQCYGELCIGVARPSIEELETVPHHFIASHSIEQQISAGEYERLALAYCNDVFSKSDRCVLVGGTGLYIKALCEGMDAMPDVDKSIEAALETEYLQKGKGWLQQEVRTLDPRFYAKADIENHRRLLRALTFKKSTGNSILEYQQQQYSPRPFDIEYFVVDVPRAQLYERINQRVDNMMQAGQLLEAQSLLPHQGNKNLDTVGYRECFSYLQGLISFDTCVQHIKQNTRHYAKRQSTWFRKQYPDREHSAEQILAQTVL